MLGALATTFLCATDLVSPFSLYFSFHLVFYRMQVSAALARSCDGARVARSVLSSSASPRCGVC
jgi:hypothetical protein